MAYTRSTVIDATPSGDSVKQAVLDLDADEHQIEFPRRDLGIGVEGLVKVPQPEQQDAVGVLLFDGEILLTQRRHRRFTHSCRTDPLQAE